MTNEEPVEAGAVLAAAGSRTVSPRAPAAGALDRSRRLLPGLVRVASAGPFLTASAVAVAAAVAAKAAEAVGRAAWQAAQVPLGGSQEGRLRTGAIEVTWTHVEVRWPS